MNARNRTPRREPGAWEVVVGDCLVELATLRASTVDAVVTDPPYGIDFLGERWDGSAIREAAARRHGRRLGKADAFQYWCSAWARECRRVLKPGGHLLAFGAPRSALRAPRSALRAPRNAHRLAAGVEDAGLDLRDTLMMWLYGTGVPKSRRLSKGRATQLKPSYEPILLARRPLAATPIERNLRRHGTGALNVDACRVNDRYPANTVLSHEDDCETDRCQPGCAVGLLDRDTAGSEPASGRRRGASRFFYCPKANRQERDAGCEALPRSSLDLFPNARAARATSKASNAHPTVKPLTLMRWLVRLGCPPRGLVLDPFCGSGSTGAAAVLEGRGFLGIECEPDYAAIARARIDHWATNAPTHLARGGDPI